jgi:hypothetical protein
MSFRRFEHFSYKWSDESKDQKTDACHDKYKHSWYQSAKRIRHSKNKAKHEFGVVNGNNQAKDYEQVKDVFQKRLEVIRKRDGQ